MNLVTIEDAGKVRDCIRTHITFSPPNDACEEDLSYLSKVMADVAEKVWAFVSLASALADMTDTFALSVHDAEEGLWEHEAEFAFSQLALTLQLMLVYRRKDSHAATLLPRILDVSSMPGGRPNSLRASIEKNVHDGDTRIVPLDAGFRLTSRFYRHAHTRKEQLSSLIFLRYIADAAYSLVDFWEISVRYWTSLYCLLEMEGAPSHPFDLYGGIMERSSARSTHVQMLHTFHYLEQILSYRNAEVSAAPSLESMMDALGELSFPY